MVHNIRTECYTSLHSRRNSLAQTESRLRETHTETETKIFTIKQQSTSNKKERQTHTEAEAEKSKIAYSLSFSVRNGHMLNKFTITSRLREKRVFQPLIPVR